MKRNKELIRQILLQLEASHDPTGLEFESRFTLYANDMVISLHGTEARPELRDRDYQLLQMEKAGLIEFVDKQPGPDFYGGKVRLMPVGHDAVEAIGDDTLWGRLKSAAPGEAYQLLKGVASTAAMKALSITMGWG